MKIFNKMSLRFRLTVLSTIVTTTVILLFTYISTYSANKIFVDEAEVTMVSMQKLSVALPPDNEQVTFKEAAVKPLQILQDVVHKIENTDEAIGVSMVSAAAVVDAVPIEFIATANGQFRSVNYIFMAVFIIAGAVAIYFITGRTLRPVGQLSTKMKNIDENSLFMRIENSNLSPEIKSMTDSFNHMLERLENAFQIQKSFAAAAAHELKTPLACIRTNIDVLQLEESPSLKEYEDIMEVIKRNTDRLMVLTEELLDMNRSYKGKTTISLLNLMEDIQRELRFLSDDKKVTVEIQGDAVLYCNFDAVYRIFYNLIENSIKYNVGGGSVNIKILQKEQEQVMVSVEDTGIGIAEEEIPSIFQPFYRIEKSRNRKIGGAGLGLSIVKELIEKCGGQITVRSQKGRGSCFQVSFLKNEPIE